MALKQNKASTLQYTAGDNYYLLRGIQLNNRLYEAQANCGFAVVDNKLYMAYLDHNRKQGNLHEYRYVLGIRELANDGTLKDIKTAEICSYVDTAATIAPMVDKKGNVFLPDTKKQTVLLNGVQIPFANLYNGTDGIAQFLDLSIHDSKLYFAASTATDKTVVGCYDLKLKKSKVLSINSCPYSAASIFQTTVVLFYKDKPNNKIALERIEL